VLPFADLSAAKDQEYFSDGLAEQLINDLAKVSRLKVVGRSSAFQFKGKNEDVRDVGRKLGVANVLEGSVRREGNHVRITAELTKADDGFQLWSQTYDREIKDIFAIQDEIALSRPGRCN
jgi:TolB-like protein